MSLRTSVDLSVQIGADNDLSNLVASRGLPTQLFDSLSNVATSTAKLAAGETNYQVPFGDVSEARLVYIEADGAIDVTLGGGLASSASVTAAAGVYNAFVGGETLDLEIDNQPIAVVFDAADTTLAKIVNRINAAAALVGIAPIAADSGGELAITSTTTGVSSEVDVSGGTGSVTLGLTVGVTNGTNATAGTSPVALRKPTSGDSPSTRAYLLSTASCSSITIDNADALNVEVLIVLAGDIVSGISC